VFLGVTLLSGTVTPVEVIAQGQKGRYVGPDPAECSNPNSPGVGMECRRITVYPGDKSNETPLAVKNHFVEHTGVHPAAKDLYYRWNTVVYTPWINIRKATGNSPNDNYYRERIGIDIPKECSGYHPFFEVRHVNNPASLNYGYHEPERIGEFYTYLHRLYMQTGSYVFQNEDQSNAREVRMGALFVCPVKK
jgi:hypothetical protein